MNDHYLSYQNLIFKCAWQRVRKNPNLDFQDCVSEGNLAYAEALQTWDPEKGCFSTHLFWQLRHRLGYQNQQKIDDDNFLTDLDQAMELAGTDDPSESCSFAIGLSSLSDEATEVVKLILGSSGELCDFTMATVKVIRGNIHKYMRSLAWPPRKITRTMTEIKMMLQNL